MTLGVSQCGFAVSLNQHKVDGKKLETVAWNSEKSP